MSVKLDIGQVWIPIQILSIGAMLLQATPRRTPRPGEIIPWSGDGRLGGRSGRRRRRPSLKKKKRRRKGYCREEKPYALESRLLQKKRRKKTKEKEKGKDLPPVATPAICCSSQGSEIVDEDITRMFLKERQVSGDFISKASDVLWRGDMLKFDDLENNSLQVNQQSEKLVEDDKSIEGFLKLTKTREWVAGDNVAPANKRLATKDLQNDSEKRKKFNLLKYGAIKRELLLLTVGIGSGCCIYCLVLLSVQVAFSYATGVFFSCLYLQLLYLHMDNLSKETVPEVFTRRKLKKIGIRSEDLQYTLEKIFYGSTMAFSSPRLVIPAAIYGLWILSEHTLSNIEFELVPAMLGFFAYKAAALVQVYRDNLDLRLIFPDNESL